MLSPSASGQNSYPKSAPADDRGAVEPVVAISSSLDESLGQDRAPLDANLTVEQVAAIVWRALDMDTSPRNLREMVRPGSWVVVKPNIVTSPSNPDCMYWYGGRPHRGQNTDLRVIKALVDYILLHCRPRRISIAEGGAEWERIGEPDTDPQITEDGWTVHWPEYGGLSYADLVAQWGESHPGVVDLVDLNYDERRFGPVPDPRGSGIGALQRRGAKVRPQERYGRNAYVEGTGTLRDGYAMPATILDCDVLISVPAMKTHLHSGTSLVLKNYVGVTPPALDSVSTTGRRERNSQVRNFKKPVHEGDIYRGIVDVFSYHPADYSVVEGFWGTEGNGPQWGDDTQHNVVIVGSDPVAVEAVACTVMGYNPEDLEVLQLAAKKCFGEIDLSRIRVVGAPISTVQRLYRMGTGRSGMSYAGRGIRSWLVAPATRAGQGLAAADWRRIDSEARYVNLAYYLGPDAPNAIWAYSELECDQEVTSEAWFGADGFSVLYVNGQKVVNLTPADGHRLAEARVPLSLPPGRSGLLIRVDAGISGFGFSLLVCGQPGCLPLGVHYRTPDVARAHKAMRTWL